MRVKIEYIFINLLYFVLIFCRRYILPMTSGSTGEKIKEKVKETMGTGEGGGEKIKEKVKETMGTGEGGGQKIKEKVKETMGTGEGGGQKIKEKVKETMGMGSGRGGSEGRKGELGPGAASEVEEEVAKTSSDSPTKKVEGSGKALGKEEGAAE